MKRLLHETRSHHKDESVDHHEENELGRQSAGDNSAKNSPSGLKIDEAEAVLMKLRKLLHEESHHDDPHELRREDEWHRYRKLGEHNAYEHREEPEMRRSYLDDTMAVNHLPHGNPALDGQHGRIDIEDRSVLLAGPEHHPTVHHEESPHRDNHGETYFILLWKVWGGSRLDWELTNSIKMPFSKMIRTCMQKGCFEVKTYKFLSCL